MLDMDVASRFAHHLLAGARFFRHEDQKIALNFSDTGQSMTGLFFFGDDKFFFFFLPGADVGHFGLDAVFLKTTFFDADFALAANFLFTTEGLDIHPQQSGRF